MPSLRFLSFLEMKILFINGQKCPAILILSGLMCLCFYSIFKGRILWQFANNLTRFFSMILEVRSQDRSQTSTLCVCCGLVAKNHFCQFLSMLNVSHYSPTLNRVIKNS